MKEMISLIYMSQAVKPMSVQELTRIITYSRTHNESKDITGVLLYLNDKFFQILEGDSVEVTGLYSRIQQDKRHHSVTLLLSDTVDERIFNNWSMGFVDKTDINNISGENAWSTEDLMEHLNDRGKWNPAYEFLKIFYRTNVTDIGESTSGSYTD
ncbi:MAG: BLUF domain-containing protein [Cyclobacteriaceae bacterium]